MDEKEHTTTNPSITEDIYSTSDEKPLVLLINEQRKAGMKRKKTVNEPKHKKVKLVKRIQHMMSLFNRISRKKMRQNQ